MTAILDATREVTGVQRVGEKTPDHARHLDVLLGDFPDARVIHVVRDPRATVASELRLDRDWASDDPEVAASRWARGVAPLRAHGDDPRVLVVRYEQLVRAPEPTLRTLCDHVGLSWDPAVLAPGPGHPDYRHGDQDPWAGIGTGSLDTWQDELTPSDLLAVARHARPGAALLGYPDPAEGVGLADRLVDAPAALRRVAGRARRRLTEAGR